MATAKNREKESKKLEGKPLAFVEFYCGEAGRNGSKAARLAGYSEKTAGQQAYRLLRDPRVKAAINERFRELQMQTDELLFRLAEQARTTMENFLTIERDEHGEITGVYPDLVAAAKANKLHLIKEVQWTKAGLKFKLEDRQHAMELIGKYLGLFVDRTFSSDVDSEFDLDEWRARREERRRRSDGEE